MGKNSGSGINKNLKLGLAGRFTEPSSFFVSYVMFILPLIVTNGYYNITATKYYSFLFSAVIFLVAFAVLLIWYSAEYKPKISFKVIGSGLNPLDISFILFGFFTVVSALFSEYQSDVWTGKSSRYQGAITLVIYILIYFIVSRNYKQKQSFLLSAVTAFDLVSIFGVLNCFSVDVFGFYERLTEGQMAAYISTVGNINFYSSYICLLLPLTFCGFCQVKEKVSRIFYTVSLVIGTFGMMVTSSESFVIGFIFSVAVIPLFFLKDKDKLKRFAVAGIIVVVTSQIFNLIYTLAEKYTDAVSVKISALLSIFLKPYTALLLIGFCLLIYLISSRFPQKIKVFGCVYISAFALAVAGVISMLILMNTVWYDKDLGYLDTLFKITPEWGTLRGKIWRHCTDCFGDFSLKEKLFGIGPEALYRITEGVFDKNLDQAHNEYLQYLMTEGIFGVLSYISVIVSASYLVIKKLGSNTLAVGMFAGLVSYWIQAFVNIAQPFSTPIMYIFLACLGGIYYNKKVKAD